MSIEWRSLLAPPHPTFRSRRSKEQLKLFVDEVFASMPQPKVVNLGSAWIRLHPEIINLDLFAEDEVDLQGDLLALPFSDDSLDAVICNGVLEHVKKPEKAVNEIRRVLKNGAVAYVELPWMQGVHASPDDYQRWTPEGIQLLFYGLNIEGLVVACGPASALAWMFQEVMAMLFSFGNTTLYKVGLRLFGWLAIPLSWFDILLERHPQAWRTASGYLLRLRKE